MKENGEPPMRGQPEMTREEGRGSFSDKDHPSDEEIMDMIANLVGGNIPAMQGIRNRLIGVLEGELRRRNPKG